MKLVFASNNSHKLEEVKSILGKDIQILSLNDIGFSLELPETTGTIMGNAIQKATALFEATSLLCFADDSGLEVRALHGLPGVDSAHYAGPQRDTQANYERVLHELAGKQDRSARFVTMISLILPTGSFLFEGEVAGRIANEPSGEYGFGYDPVFIPDGYTSTFAQLPGEIKNQISHRAMALNKMADFLRSLNSK
jgi:XTP/dITP diphosphohydrolase